MNFGITISKYDKKAKLASIDTGNIVQHIQTKVVYQHISKDVENMVDTLNYLVERPLSMGKSKSVFEINWVV